jgi:hypothetical protein
MSGVVSTHQRLYRGFIRVCLWLGYPHRRVLGLSEVWRMGREGMELTKRVRRVEATSPFY